MIIGSYTTVQAYDFTTIITAVFVGSAMTNQPSAVTHKTSIVNNLHFGQTFSNVYPFMSAKPFTDDKYLRGSYSASRFTNLPFTRNDDGMVPSTVNKLTDCDEC